MSGEVDVWASDFMNRKPSSEFLTKYILANDHVKVLNVNSPWGSGKSFFLERWKAALSQDHVCVLFNAWETDYSAEPLLALITCIEQQTKDDLDVTSSEAGKRVVDLSTNIIKKAAPLIAKGLVRKYVGVDLDDLFGEKEGGDAVDAVGGLVSSLIEDQSKTTKHVDEFKAALIERLVNAADNRGLKKPAFIFIDELDRCRPTYAIELLERIKHFFELEGCRFVIASDSKQLAHSIRAVYGQGFSSEQYLNRFFDAEFSLSNGNVFDLVRNYLPVIDSASIGVNITGQVVENMFDREPVAHAQKNTIVSDLDGLTENQLIIAGLSKYFKVELRELTNYIKQIKSAADTIGGEVQFFWLAYLVFFKGSRAEEYSDLWTDDKWKVAVTKFERDKSSLVTFSFTRKLCSPADIALLYLDMLNSSRADFQRMNTDLGSWKNGIFYSAGKDLDRLRTYKDVVELAHRLK